MAQGDSKVLQGLAGVAFLATFGMEQADLGGLPAGTVRLDWLSLVAGSNPTGLCPPFPPANGLRTV